MRDDRLQAELDIFVAEMRQQDGEDTRISWIGEATNFTELFSFFLRHLRRHFASDELLLSP